MEAKELRRRLGLLDNHFTGEPSVIWEHEMQLATEKAPSVWARLVAIGRTSEDGRYVIRGDYVFEVSRTVDAMGQRNWAPPSLTDSLQIIERMFHLLHEAAFIFEKHLAHEDRKKKGGA